MWIVSTHGFISLVQDRDNSDLLQVRARVRDDITNHFPHARVFVAEGGDYRYRARISKNQVAVRLADHILNELTYESHFKDVALAADKKHLSSRRTAYYGAWSAFAGMQDYRPYSKVPRDQEKIPTAPISSQYSYGPRDWYSGTTPKPSNVFGSKIEEREEATLPDLSLADLVGTELTDDLFETDDKGYYSLELMDAIVEAFGVEPDSLSDDELEDLIDQLAALHTHDGLTIEEPEDAETDEGEDEDFEPTRSKKHGGRHGKRIRHRQTTYVNRSQRRL